jgi:OmpA-OmpF porin, OOP family
MKKTFIPAALITVLLSATYAHADKAQSTTGPYIGSAFGSSVFNTRDISAPKTLIDEKDRVFKLYGGYQLNESFGVQAAYVGLGKLNDSFRVGGTTVKQTANLRSFYLAGTGRYALGESFALTGKVGLSFGKATGTNQLGSANSIIGTNRSLMAGIGAEYRVTDNLALTVDYETFGKLSNKVTGDAVLAGVKLNF